MYYAHQYMKFYNEKELLSLQTSDAFKKMEREREKSEINNRKVA